MTEIFFAHPHTLFSQVGRILDRIGPENFFKSSAEEIKKAREGFSAYFFTLALKKYTGRDWWLAQFDQAVRPYPDFYFISFSEKLEDIKIEPVELVSIYPGLNSFNDFLEIIEKKQKKYGDKPLKISLLIFVNHEKSGEWINLLRMYIKKEHPFLSIWTIHLRNKKGLYEVIKAVAQRIVPLPYLKVEADTDDPEIHKRQPLPNYVEEHRTGESIYVKFKPEFVEKMRKATMES